ncbi:ribonuclease domain-containing protein [Chryseobacterium oryzae]|uniref:Ribonuclease n=1 Tax=Chryseobacterium oryzae TaxID=2929799 RepID=A0ABY4BPE1_9FLAO|nr:ribonuclease domain-containing protein [Chryseobacterium oryzae]UOE39583.1 ribonuclease N [Chryseobacterium oryzae]
MNSKIRSVMFACLGLLFGMSVMYVYNNFIAEKKAENTTINDVRYGETKNTDEYNNSQNFNDITELTEENKVISYVKENHHLPEYYITKSEAKKQGWNPSQGNLCEVLPGKAIGGDYFGNREGRLPKDEKYFEADVNYSCGNRNADRIIFTKNGDVYLTKDHYRSFEKK